MLWHYERPLRRWWIPCGRGLSPDALRFDRHSAIGAEAPPTVSSEALAHSLRGTLRTTLTTETRMARTPLFGWLRRLGAITREASTSGRPLAEVHDAFHE